MNKKILIALIFTLSSCSIVDGSDDVSSNDTSMSSEDTTNLDITTTTSSDDVTSNESSKETSKISDESTSEISSEDVTSQSSSDVSSDTSEQSNFVSKTKYASDEVYSASDRGQDNPYGIDVSEYGENVFVAFYEPNLINDPYTSIDVKEFYSSYTPASSYEDAYFRSKHHLMSGNIEQTIDYLPNSVGESYMVDETTYAYCSNATYTLDSKGNYLSYSINTLNGDKMEIYYGGAYTTMEEVAAYLLAFGEEPINNLYSTSNSGRNQTLSDWGIYGRVNHGVFSGDTSRYPYEPLLPDIMGSNSITYHETDFGSSGGFECNNITQKPYNDGESISRSVCRFVFVCDENVKSIDKRHVFYTYNHYNDFNEYLNYYNGWGIRFGNETAGNTYNRVDVTDPTPYAEIFKTSLLNLLS